MFILGIETSCDETAMSIIKIKEKEYQVNQEVRDTKNYILKPFSFKIIANNIHSQIDVHKEFGGVYPMMAKREHIKNLPIVYEKTIKDAVSSKGSDFKSEKDIGLIAVTSGPGLEPALWTGIDFAKNLASKLNIKAVPINHMEGHIMASIFDCANPEDREKEREILNIRFPALSILISGGHTELVLMNDFGQYQIVGKTRDDAIGEAFDKTARMMGLPYPGGPLISKLAEKAREQNIHKVITLPRPMLHSDDFDFSFAGLKTAVLYGIKKIREEKNNGAELTENQKMALAMELEDAVTEVLISKSTKVIENVGKISPESPIQSIILGGGVIANKTVRDAFQRLAERHGLDIHLPEIYLSGDNALMIALACATRAYGRKNEMMTAEQADFKASGNLNL